MSDDEFLERFAACLAKLDAALAGIDSAKDALPTVLRGPAALDAIRDEIMELYKAGTVTPAVDPRFVHGIPEAVFRKPTAADWKRHAEGMNEIMKDLKFIPVPSGVEAADGSR